MSADTGENPTNESGAENEITREEMKKLDSIVKSIHDPKSGLIRVLQETQKEFAYLKSSHMKYLAEAIGTSHSKIYGVATFYSQFNLYPPGRHTIFVCQGTGCHVKGGKEILEKIKEETGIEVRQTTEDRRFSLKSVRCLGCCGLAPVIMIDDTTFGRVKSSQVPGILDNFQ